ncbi:MAG: transcription antitermination factor NusB [Puniceicoccales bacterium]|jgi:N utilization substance protein B|nr:transcription antitermination factor NusB [Puniceicoccales bacterium]
MMKLPPHATPCGYGYPDDETSAPPTPDGDASQGQTHLGQSGRAGIIPPGAIPLPPPEPPQNSRRRLNRIAAMQFLYAWDITRPENVHNATRSFFESQEHERDYYAFAEELANGAMEKHADIDETIRAFAQNWKINRIAKVDLAILRLAAYELLYRPDIPPIVSINEAIEISKQFSTPEAKRFINGMLDKIKDQLTRPAREAAISIM